MLSLSVILPAFFTSLFVLTVLRSSKWTGGSKLMDSRPLSRARSPCIRRSAQEHLSSLGPHNIETQHACIKTRSPARTSAPSCETFRASGGPRPLRRTTMLSAFLSIAATPKEHAHTYISNAVNGPPVDTGGAGITK